MHATRGNGISMLIPCPQLLRVRLRSAMETGGIPLTISNVCSVCIRNWVFRHCFAIADRNSWISDRDISLFNPQQGLDLRTAVALRILDYSSIRQPHCVRQYRMPLLHPFLLLRCPRVSGYLLHVSGDQEVLSRSNCRSVWWSWDGWTSERIF